MSWHEVWHVGVLGSTLFAAAGVVTLVLAPLIFDDPPPGLIKARPLILGLVTLAALLLALEWLGVHGG
ncbi:MAG: hypothetical protein M3285_11990 [Actinomycetota bacterium]|nr:hypothetical protein [Actinomycetota bacterium]